MPSLFRRGVIVAKTPEHGTGRTASETPFQPVLQPAPGEPCVFCEVIAGRSPRRIRHEDDDLLVIENALRWVPVMLLVLPKAHMSQEEFWQSALFAKASSLAVDIAKEDSPNGYRLLSNVGPDGMQSQAHGHLHILGGQDLGLYLWGRWPGSVIPSTYGGPEQK